MANIPDFPTRPGGPQLTDLLYLIDPAGEGADYKATIAALVAAVFGNISVNDANTIRALTETVVTGSFTTSTSQTINHDFRGLARGSHIVTFGGQGSNTEFEGVFLVTAMSNSAVAGVHALGVTRYAGGSFPVTVTTYNGLTAGIYSAGNGGGFRITVGATPAATEVTWRAVRQGR